ncbi:MAG TPA: hypothetical protein P5268_05295 [Candidatus Marinimicrobia bacterium]|nr:hypothetical protein [Candidatus Neomarinimicrobiota bacterium]
MKFIPFVIFYLFALLQFSIADENPHIYHIPPKTLNQNSPGEITCVVTPGDRQLKWVKIFLRDDSSEFYKEFTMQCREGIWYLPLIPEMISGDYLDYFIIVEFEDFSTLAFPSEQPAEKPIRVKIVSFPKI